MAMSLDGLVNDRDGGLGHLYPDLAVLRQTEVRMQVTESAPGTDLRSGS
jgi:hypothetical protein